MAKRTFIVTYDVSSPRRWRHVYRLMRSFGEHIQLSVFRCDLNAAQRVRLRSALDEVIHHHEDQVFIIDIGETTVLSLRGIDVLGRPHAFRVPVARII